jgi:formylglycine-generating enzyme
MKDFALPLSQNLDIRFVFVQGTHGAPYLFGVGNEKIAVNVNDFYISKFPVTQAVWEYVMGSNPAFFKESSRPVEGVSFNDIVLAGGFLEKLNALPGIKSQVKGGTQFRLPTETEWEYAARGGVHWKDDFLYSGSNDISEVAWQGDKHSGTETHPVGTKKANQLGIHDMCGNVWEWCEDFYHSVIDKIPKDGTPLLEESDSRVLRGGCHHNWPIHCTVSKRYEIGPQFKDPCIGFRVALPAVIAA